MLEDVEVALAEIDRRDIVRHAVLLVARDHGFGAQRVELVQHPAPRQALGLEVLAQPQVHAVEQQVAPDEGFDAGHPDRGGMLVVALHRAEDFDAVALQHDGGFTLVQRAGHTGIARALWPQHRAPALELQRERAPDVLHHLGVGHHPGLWKGVHDHVQAEEMVRVVVRDDDGLQPLARVQDRGNQAVRVGAREGHVHQHEALAADDQRGIDVQAAHGGRHRLHLQGRLVRPDGLGEQQAGCEHG